MNEIWEARKRKLSDDVREATVKLMAHQIIGAAAFIIVDPDDPSFVIAAGDVGDVMSMVERYRNSMGDN